MMTELHERVRAANEKLDALILHVCGQCRDSCCHQGTMMGGEGLRRLYKGVLMDPAFAERLHQGLHERALEVREDLEIARTVEKMLHSTELSDESVANLPELEARVADLQRYVEFLESDYRLDQATMGRLLLYSAVRSNLLRCLRKFPGGEAALTTLGRGKGSFRYRGRKIAPPRCIFHLNRCLAEDWRPIKCANFFCTGDPNLLHACRELMDFDDFVLANVVPVDEEFVRGLIDLENRLGETYWEPKVVLGGGGDWESFVQEIIHSLSAHRTSVQVRREPDRFMKSTNEVLAELRALPAGVNLVHVCHSVDGAALYELAVALDRARSSEWHGGFLLFARELAERSFLPHPMWDDEMISQPLGGLEIYLI